MLARCLCKAIEFEFEPKHNTAINCHCSMCRQSHGAAYATQLFASKASLRFIKGQEKLTEYPSSPMGLRVFCSVCGSRLMNYAKAHSDFMSVALAAVVDAPNIHPSANAFYANRVQWCDPTQNLTHYDALPDDIGKYF
ncbi:GFA family protein [Saccharophagus degradans]|uniref:GFA family protein n=1 Tax=Saccharophagus degradans TaxID=86304 RepID=UPI001C083BB3|nr:GFA family protein [Saccharophagus degradans]MBU2984561.1 GFA family protein [Saccharophagus degradans]WGO98208.1 GFA family protein [Saccharophagus degradans]